MAPWAGIGREGATRWRRRQPDDRHSPPIRGHAPRAARAHLTSFSSRSQTMSRKCVSWAPESVALVATRDIWAGWARVGSGGALSHAARAQ